MTGGRARVYHSHNFTICIEHILALLSVMAPVRSVQRVVAVSCGGRARCYSCAILIGFSMRRRCQANRLLIIVGVRQSSFIGIYSTFTTVVSGTALMQCCCCEIVLCNYIPRLVLTH